MVQIKLHKRKIRLCHADNKGVSTNYLSLSQGHCAFDGAATRFQPAGLTAKPSIVRHVLAQSWALG